MPTNEPGRPAFVNPNPGHCRTCGVQLANKRQQYCTEHRAAKTPPQKRSRAVRVADANRRRGPGGAVVELVTGGGAGEKDKGRKSAPSEAEWRDGLARLAVGSTWAVGMGITRGEPRDRRGALAVELSLTDDEAEAIVGPIAARIAGTKLSRNHGRKILESLQLADPIVAGMQYLDRVHEYRFERAAREAAIANGSASPMLRSIPTAPPPAAAAAPPEGPTDDPAHVNPPLADAAAAAAVPPITGFTGGPFGAG